MPWMCRCYDDELDITINLWHKNPIPDEEISSHYFEITELETARWALTHALIWQDEDDA
jgi:hypothetical protein